MKKIYQALHLPLILLLCTSLYAQVQTPFYNTSINSHSNGFYEYLPAGYASGTESYPLIVFLHGAGDMGNGSAAELPRLLQVGLTRLINIGGFPSSFTVNGQTFRFLVISPQFSQWPDVNDIDATITYA